MSEIDIKRLRELEARATSGQWFYWEDGDKGGGMVGGIYEKPNQPTRHEPHTGMVLGGDACEGKLESDDPIVEFVIAMRNALPGLLEEIERLRAENEGLLFDIHWIGGEKACWRCVRHQTRDPKCKECWPCSTTDRMHWEWRRAGRNEG